jgi:hypothetical protein
LTVGLVGQRLPGPAHVRHYRDPTGARGPQHGRHRGRPHPTVRVEPTVRPGSQRHLRRPCHRVAFTAVLHGPRADNHGQPQSSRELRRSPSSQVTAAPDLALGAGDQFVEACVGLAVPGRPIGPWSRRTGAPEASATRWGPEPAGTRWVHAEPAGRGVQGAQEVTRGSKEPQVRGPAQPQPGFYQEAGQSSSLPTPRRTITQECSYSGRPRSRRRAGSVAAVIAATASAPGRA